MKNLKFLLLLSLPILAGCRKADPGFEMTYKRTFTIPVGWASFETFTITFADIPVDTAVFFQANNITGDKVGQIVPQTMNIRSIFSGDGSLNIIRKVEVLMFDSQLTPSSEQTIFYNDQVPISTSSQITLVPTSADVRKRFMSGNGKFRLRLKIYFNEFTQRSYDVEWSASFLAKT
jgi:hypothetical protein